MKKNALVIINENHSLMTEQKEILEKFFSSIEYLKVPAQGWTLEEMDSIIESIKEKSREYDYRNPLTLIFVSPIPYMMIQLTRAEKFCHMDYTHPTGILVRTFHNDRREKKELPDGRIIQVVAQTGWQLV